MKMNLLNLAQFHPAIVGLVSGAVLGVTQIQAADSTVEEKVKNIRAHYEEIETDLKRCTEVKSDLPDESTEGGELTAYFSGQSLRKLIAKFYGETGQAIEEYYFWNERPIFVLRVESHYNKPLSGIAKSKTEERFYFADGVLIRWLDPGKKEVPAGPEFQKRGRHWLERAEKYSALVKKSG
jgi:hypothetical protein